MRCDAGRIHTPRAPLLYYRSNQVGFPTSHIPTSLGARRAALQTQTPSTQQQFTVIAQYSTVPNQKKKRKNSTVLYSIPNFLCHATGTPTQFRNTLENSTTVTTLPLTVLQNRKNTSFPPLPFLCLCRLFFFRALLCHGCFRVCVSPVPPSLPILRARTGRDRKRYPYLLLNKIRWRWTLLCVYLFWPSPQVSSDVV